MADKWNYLGDGVYAKSDGYGVWLHDNSQDQPTDKIYLEPSVFIALKDMLKAEKEESDANSAR